MEEKSTEKSTHLSDVNGRAGTMRLQEKWEENNFFLLVYDFSDCKTRRVVN